MAAKPKYNAPYHDNWAWSLAAMGATNEEIALCENETNVKVIQEIMGHRDISTTMDIYSHVTKEKSTEIMNDLGNKIKIC